MESGGCIASVQPQAFVVKAVVLGDREVLHTVMGIALHQEVCWRDFHAGSLRVLLVTTLDFRVIDDGWRLEIAMRRRVVPRRISDANLAHGENVRVKLARNARDDAFCGS